MTKDSIVMDYKGYHNQKVTIDDMPNELFVDIAILCGVDVAVSILQNFTGNTIVVPQRGLKKLEQRIIWETYSKENDSECVRRLSRNLGLTEKTVREVLLKKYKILVIDGQRNLFRDAEISERC